MVENSRNCPATVLNCPEFSTIHPQNGGKGAVSVVSIEAMLVWAYQVEKVNEAAQVGIMLWEGEARANGDVVQAISGDGCYQIMRNHATGGRIDGGGAYAAKVHPDAEALHEIIMSGALTPRERQTLIAYGKTGIVPDWMPGAAPLARLVRRGNGKPVLVHEGKKVIGCEVEIVTTQAEIDSARVAYRAWHESLIRLVEVIKLQRVAFVNHSVQPPKPAAFPWVEKNTLALAQKV